MTFQSGCVESAARAESCSVLQIILHTGDMRWQPRLADHPALKACKVEVLYMDTTYCLPKHVFPSQVCSCLLVAGYLMSHPSPGTVCCIPVWLAPWQSSSTTYLSCTAHCLFSESFTNCHLQLPFSFKATNNNNNQYTFQHELGACDDSLCFPSRFVPSNSKLLSISFLGPIEWDTGTCMLLV